MTLLYEAIASLGRQVPWVCPVCSHGCALAGTGVSTGDTLAELAVELSILLEDSALLKLKRKGKRRSLAHFFFVFYVIITLSLLEKNDTMNF